MSLVLFAALAPSVSQALRVSDAQGWADICSAQGARGTPADPSPSQLHTLEHCPFCSVHAPTLDLPPAPAPLRLRQDLAQALPTAFWQAPRPLHAWVQAQPRAPPLNA